MAAARQQRARRDPEGRRRAIVETAAELIAEHGVAELTHRRVAERARLPLGATTYYFRSLEELSAAALGHLAQSIERELDEVAAVLDRHGNDPAALAQVLHAYLSDRRQVLTDSALYFAGAWDEALRPFALRWFDGLVGVLERHADTATARLLAVFVDGAFVHATLHEQPLAAAELERAIRALLAGDPGPHGGAESRADDGGAPR